MLKCKACGAEAGASVAVDPKLKLCQICHVLDRKERTPVPLGRVIELARAKIAEDKPYARPTQVYVRDCETKKTAVIDKFVINRLQIADPDRLVVYAIVK